MCVVCVSIWPFACWGVVMCSAFCAVMVMMMTIMMTTVRLMKITPVIIAMVVVYIW